MAAVAAAEVAAVVAEVADGKPRFAADLYLKYHNLVLLVTNGNRAGSVDRAGRTTL